MRLQMFPFASRAPSALPPEVTVFELPEDLSALSRDELSALLSEYEQAFDELAESASTGDDLATLTAATEAIEALRAEAKVSSTNDGVGVEQPSVGRTRSTRSTAKRARLA